MTEMKRTGVYMPQVALDLLDAYAKARGKSRNSALTELIIGRLAPELLEVKPEVLERAVKQVQADLEVSDGEW